MSNGVFSSLIWKFFNSGTAQIIQLVVSIIVARLLTPTDFGIVALLLVFTSIATVFVQAGLGTAIIQKNEISQVELSSIFYYSLFSAILFYVILFFIAPFVGAFYKLDNISVYLRVISLVLLPGSFNTIQNALVAKKMLWKQQCVCNVISVFCSGIIGVVLAKLNYGAWAIICQQLSYNLIICLSLFFIVKWLPSISFSFKKSMPLFKYGFNLLGANLIDTVFHNLENIIIGKKFVPSTLAFFTKGKMFPYLLVTNIDNSLQSVMLPVFSSKQKQIDDLKLMLRKTISLSTFVLCVVLIILFLCAEPMILILLGNQWLECVPFIKLYCIIGLFIPIQTTSLQAINAIGLSKIYLKIISTKRSLGVILLFISAFLFESVFAIVWTAFIVEIIAVCMQMYYNKKYLQYMPREFFKDISKNLIAGISVLFLYNVYKVILPQNFYITIIIVSLFSASIYVFVLYVLKSRELSFLIQKISRKDKS